MSLEQLAGAVADMLVERGETIAVSESSAGGLVSAALLAVPGASRYYLGGGVVYTGAARAALLELPTELPPELRSASEPYAALCARTARERLGATWGLAETGAAGPTGNRYGDDAGHSCVAVHGPVSAVATVETRAHDRVANMWDFARAALALMESTLESAPR